MSEKLTANGRPVPGGFTGTIRDFLDWLGESLAYGGVTVSQKPYGYEVSLVTGGYSDDEDLLHRVRRSIFAQMFWESEHRGGLYIYEVPTDRFESDAERAWLEPKADVFESVHRARHVVTRAAHGGETMHWRVPYGVTLAYREPHGAEPDGTLIIEEIAAADSLWGEAA